MNRVTVTGANGFIGSNLLSRLSHHYSEVYAVSTNQENKSFNNKIIWVTQDLNEIDNFTYKKVGSPQTLVHLAWSSLRDLNNKKHILENYRYHLTFLKYMIDSGVKTLFVSGTCLEYKIQNNFCLSEESEVFPVSNYAKAKNKLRVELEEYIKDRNCQLIWGRIFYLYGPFQQKETLFGQFLASKNLASFNLNNPDYKRDYLNVEILVDYIIKLLRIKEKLIVVNLCSGKPIKIIELVKHWKKTHQAKCKISNKVNEKIDPKGINSFWGDNTRLKSLLNEIK